MRGEIYDLLYSVQTTDALFPATSVDSGYPLPADADPAAYDDGESYRVGFSFTLLIIILIMVLSG